MRRKVYKKTSRSKVLPLLAVIAVVCSVFFLSKYESFASTEMGEFVTAGSGFFEEIKNFLELNIKTIFTQEEPETFIIEEEPKEDTSYYGKLVNKNNSLDRDFKPENMINLAEHVYSIKGTVMLEETAAEAYIAMSKAMNEDGIKGLALVSGFRDYDYQSGLHNAEINKQLNYYNKEKAREVAATIVAAPGTSEHQLGLAVDVSSKEVGYGLSSRFESTEAFMWLEDNAYKFGFVVRYPKDKMDYTGVIYEPWHLRYFGEELAENIYDSGMCYEEFLEDSK